MKSNLGRTIAGAFILALTVYAGSFWGINHLRTRKGPWEVTYQTGDDAVPTIRIDQPSLGWSNVTIRFPGETVQATTLPQTIRFDEPRSAGPFGETVFIDPTFLPGTVTLNFFGHEVQLMPRVLTVNRQEIAWRSGLVLDLDPANKQPSRPLNRP